MSTHNLNPGETLRPVRTHTYNYELIGPGGQFAEVSVQAPNLEAAEKALKAMGHDLSFQGGWLIDDFWIDGAKRERGLK